MIFQTQLTTLDSQINQLLAQVEAARQKQAQLTELDALTDSSLTQLKTVVSKIEHYDKSAIANLKNAVLGLFGTDDDSGDHGGNQPIEPTPDTDPTPGDDPTPSDDEPSFIDEDSLEYPTLEGQSCDIGHDLDWYWERCAKLEGQAWEFASFLELGKPLVAGSRFWFGGKDNTGTVIRGLKDEYLCQIDGAVGEVELERRYLHYVSTTLEGQSCDVDSAPKTGQSCDWASPFASPLCSLLWEDTPMLGQHCIIFPSATENNENKGTSEGEAMSYVQLVKHPENGAIAYQRKHDGEIICVYVGFRTKAIAQSWLHFFEAVTSKVELRQAKRLELFKWEVKAWGLSMKQIERYAGDCDFSKSYRAEIGSAKQSKSEVVLPIDKVKPGQKIRTKDGLELTIMSAGCFDDKTFFAKDANEQRQLIELDNVAEFLPAESAAQQLGIEPPSDWGKPQVEAPHEPITPGALVRHYTDAKFNTFEYGIVQEISESSAKLWSDETGSSTTVAIADLELISADPQYARIIIPNSQWRGKSFVVVKTVQTNNFDYSLLTPKGILGFWASDVEILDAEVEEIASGSEPEQSELPIYQRSDGGFQVEQAIQENASILQVGDIVEVTGTRHPQHFGLVGTVEALSSFSELPISVRTPRGLKGYLRSDLKFISKGDKPQSPGLQSGQLLMGDRVITSGNYIGSARISRMLSAQLGTADKIAAIELAKDLKKLGFDPRLAATVMAGEDDASDF